MKLIRFLPSEKIEALPPSLHFDALHDLTLQQHACDEHWELVDALGNSLARGSIWWNQVPALPNQRLGIIGHFASSSFEATQQLLTHLCGRLKDQKCTMAIGPMDGNTWRKYRFVTETGSESPFFLEPQNPSEWPQWFLQCGFTSLAEYSSSLITDLQKRDPRVNRVRERLEKSGISIQSLQLDRFDEELQEIHQVSSTAFTHNFLYTPLSLDHFHTLYEPIRPHIVPELVFLAKKEGKLVGYLFGIPDLAQAQRGQKVDTTIIKTLAVLPGKSYGGLGALLVDEFHYQSRKAGFGRCIHALEYQGNGKVQHLSQFFGDVMRRYTLFARPL
ncbi:MAG: hypothetical protein B9S32_09630 [Verrucomicrobia bacterium Tous-C9LFEB]|nr:MAG: hypothetical protein B9S32_09630 [Verrucomicrobia bacterium Tous-C9LFEB]